MEVKQKKHLVEMIEPLEDITNILTTSNSGMPANFSTWLFFLITPTMTIFTGSVHYTGKMTGCRNITWVTMARKIIIRECLDCTS